MRWSRASAPISRSRSSATISTSLIDKANEVAQGRPTIQGTGDIKVDRVVGQQNLTVTIDRQAIARYGLNASDVHDVIEAAIGGKAATEIYEGERRFQAIVRLPENLRNSIAEIRQHPGDRIATASRFRSKSGEHQRWSQGPAQIKREMAKRRIVVGINVRDRDLGGFVAELQQKVGEQVTFPPAVLLSSGAASSRTWSAHAGT